MTRSGASAKYFSVIPGSESSTIEPGGDVYLHAKGTSAEIARMSHEASIGKIAPRQVQYLMAHGMEERETISMIIRGFLDADIQGLGPELDKRIAEIAELAGYGEN